MLGEKAKLTVRVTMFVLLFLKLLILLSMPRLFLADSSTGKTLSRKEAKDNSSTLAGIFQSDEKEKRLNALISRLEAS